jgi:hypothetical protein
MVDGSEDDPMTREGLGEEQAPLPPIPSYVVHRLAGRDPYALIDEIVRDGSSARTFAGADRGIEALAAAHPSKAPLLLAEGAALAVDPVWLDEGDDNSYRVARRGALAAITSEGRAHLATRSNQTDNLFIRARYAHVLWRLSRANVDLGRQAARAYLGLGARALAAGEGHDAADALDRSSEIAVVIRDSQLGTEVSAAIESAAAELEAADGYRWIIDLSTSVERLARRLMPGVLAGFLPVLNRAVDFFAAGPPPGYQVRRRFQPPHTEPSPRLADSAVERLTVLRQLAGHPEAAVQGAARRGALWEAHARTQLARAEPRVAALAVRQHLVTAEHWYREAGDRDAAARMRVMIEGLRERIAGEMISYRSSVPISPPEVEALIGPISGAPTLHDALDLLSATPDLLPREADGQRHREAQTVGDTLMPPVNFDVAGNRATGTGAVAAGDARESNYYNVAMQVSQFFVTRLFQRLRAREDFTAPAVMEWVAARPLFDFERAPFLESTIASYVRADHIAFMRTVMPEFEAFVRHVAAGLGVPTTVANRRTPGVDEERGLEDLLTREPALTAALGADLSYNSRQLLVRKSGLQLRHADAHALLPPGFYSDDWADVLLLLLLRLLAASPSRPS